MTAASLGTQSFRYLYTRTWAQQPQRVGDDNECCPSVGENRQSKTRVSRKRECEKYHLHSQRERDVCLYDADSATAKLNRLGHFAQVVLHQCHVRRLQRRVCSGCTHCNANARGCHCGRVVHTVADHADVFMLGHQFADALYFLFGKQIAEGLVNARLPGDGVNGALIVATQHDDILHTGIMERTNGFGGIGANRIAHSEDAEDFTFAVRVRL